MVSYETRATTLVVVCFRNSSSFPLLTPLALRPGRKDSPKKRRRGSTWINRDATTKTEGNDEEEEGEQGMERRGKDEEEGDETMKRSTGETTRRGETSM